MSCGPWAKQIHQNVLQHRSNAYRFPLQWPAFMLWMAGMLHSRVVLSTFMIHITNQIYVYGYSQSFLKVALPNLVWKRDRFGAKCVFIQQVVYFAYAGSQSQHTLHEIFIEHHDIKNKKRKSRIVVLSDIWRTIKCIQSFGILGEFSVCMNALKKCKVLIHFAAYGL